MCILERQIFFFLLTEMENEKIPDKNLPFYLQKYSIKIVDKTENEKYGTVLYTTVGAIPSEEREGRMWQLNLTGLLKPGLGKYFIMYDFTNSDLIDKRKFGSTVTGIFTVCGRVLESSKMLKVHDGFTNSESLLILELDTAKWDFSLKKESVFSYSLTIDSTPSDNPSLGYKCAFSVQSPDGTLEKEGYARGEIGNLLIPKCSDVIDSSGNYLTETYRVLCKDAKYTGYTNDESLCEEFFNNKDYVRLVKNVDEDALCASPLTEVPSGNLLYTKADFSECEFSEVEINKSQPKSSFGS